ncbi:MAG: HTH domain-containing protein [Cytophagales bacterium]|nr:HTH domain-containing protein [Cytophagales bacterium]
MINHFLEQARKLKRFQKLLENERTGSPSELGEKIGVSRTQIYNMIDQLRSKGACITYDRSAKTYRLDGKYPLKIQIEELSEEEYKNISGGDYGKITSVLSIVRSKIIFGGNCFIKNLNYEIEF